MSFFKQTLQARLNQYQDKYPLLKLNELLDWTAIADILRKAMCLNLLKAMNKVSYA